MKLFNAAAAAKRAGVKRVLAREINCKLAWDRAAGRQATVHIHQLAKFIWR